MLNSGNMKTASTCCASQSLSELPLGRGANSMWGLVKTENYSFQDSKFSNAKDNF